MAKSIFYSGDDYCSFSMNLRLRRSLARKQKIKITALVGLPDMCRIHRAVSTLVKRRRRPVKPRNETGKCQPNRKMPQLSLLHHVILKIAGAVGL
jgi:hypothetical protein